MTARAREGAAEQALPEQGRRPGEAAPPFAHLSLELGHFYPSDLRAGPARLREQFDRVAPWAEAARRACAAQVSPAARISTCVLIDDHAARRTAPSEVLPKLLAVAADAGLDIDYLARESACARAGAVRPARLVEARLAPSLAAGPDGSRPAPRVNGWLSNGERSPAAGAPGGGPLWRPPREREGHRHSVFVDIELWSERSGGRAWSCSFLAAVWQLLRLGLLRDRSRAVLEAVPATGEFPDSWRDLPPLIRIRPEAEPFTAYRTCSVLPSGFLPVEHAVKVVLDHWAPPPEALAQLAAHAAHEGRTLPAEVAHRVDYVFYGPS
ncbi:SCO2522 family protein [Kitasatospora sp. NPDC018058]|uniref:SCO2522 family protein n=1 Tax=Kitasatospora sp. NPDC018058 TaxID=3364025 RepID=UPI0037BEE323